MNIARIYLRVSTEEQDLTRQAAIEHSTRAAGYYVAGIYREKASGARLDRPVLNQLIEDLQPGDVIVAEHIDRITRLPLLEAEKLIDRIKEKRAFLSIPGIIDLSQIQTDSEIARIVLDSFQTMLCRIALQIARDDYERLKERQAAGIERAKQANVYKGKAPDLKRHQLIIELRKTHSIKKTAELAECSTALVKIVMRQHNKNEQPT